MTARRGYRLIDGALPFDSAPSRWSMWLRRRLFAVTPDDAIAVIDALEAAGCRPCLAGGWGIDALLGRQSRRHADLDVIIAPETVPAARRALMAAGFHELSEGVAAGPHMPVRVVARNAAGRSVDLLPLGLEALGPRSASAPVPFGGPDPAVAGQIGHRRIRCLSAGLQWHFHQGHPARAHNRNDLFRLEARLETN